MKRERSFIKSSFLYIIATLLIVLLGSIAKYLFLKYKNVGVFTLITTRAFIVFIFGFLWLVFVKKRQKIRFNDSKRHFLLIRGITSFTSTALGFYAFKYAKLTTVLVIYKFTPVLTSIISSFVFKEKITKIEYIAMTTGFVGIILIVKPTFIFGQFGKHEPVHDTPLGIFFSVLLTFSYTFSVLLNKSCTNDFDMNIVSVVVGLISGSFSTIGMVISGEIFEFNEYIVYPCLIAIGILVYLTLLLTLMAAEYYDVGVSSTMTYSEVIFSMIAGKMFFDEEVDYLDILGTIIIVGYGIWICRYKLKNYQ